MSIKFIDAKNYNGTGYDDLLFKSYNGQLEYSHTALGVLSGIGNNGYFKSAFSGEITIVNIDGVSYNVKNGEENTIELISDVVYSFILIDDTINFKQGGSAALNYRIIGGLIQPTVAKENTIWIQTSLDISDYGIGAYPSTPYSEGDVLIQPGITSSPKFSTEKKRNVMVFLGNTYQFISSAWKKMNAYLYQSGVWTKFSSSEVIYYEPGNVAVPFVKAVQSGTPATSTTLSSSSSYYQCRISPSARGNWGWGGLLQRVDLTNITSIVITGTRANLSGNTGGVYAGVWSSSTVAIAGVGTTADFRNSLTYTALSSTTTLNVSNITGVRYIGVIGAVGNLGGMDLRITKTVGV